MQGFLNWNSLLVDYFFLSHFPFDSLSIYSVDQVLLTAIHLLNCAITLAVQLKISCLLSGSDKLFVVVYIMYYVCCICVQEGFILSSMWYTKKLLKRNAFSLSLAFWLLPCHAIKNEGWGKWRQGKRSAWSLGAIIDGSSFLRNRATVRRWLDNIYIFLHLVNVCIAAFAVFWNIGTKSLLPVYLMTPIAMWYFAARNCSSISWPYWEYWKQLRLRLTVDLLCKKGLEKTKGFWQLYTHLIVCRYKKSQLWSCALKDMFPVLVQGVCFSQNWGCAICGGGRCDAQFGWISRLAPLHRVVMGSYHT